MKITDHLKTDAQHASEDEQRAIELSASEEHETITAVDRMLTADTSREHQLLRNLGFTYQVEHDQRYTTEALHKKLVNELFGEDSYRPEAIQKIAEMYRLRFVPVNYYIGTLPAAAVAKLRDFATQLESATREHRLNAWDYSIEDRMFILAPAELLDLPVVSRKEESAKRRKARREALARLAQDPALFFAVDTRSDLKDGPDFRDLSVFRKLQEEDRLRFVPVAEWGEEFNRARLLKSWPLRTPAHMAATLGTVAFLLSMVIVMLAPADLKSLKLAAMAALPLVLAWGFWAWFTDSENHTDLAFSRTNWLMRERLVK